MSRTQSPKSLEEKGDDLKNTSIDEPENKVQHSTPNTKNLKRRPLRDFQTEDGLYPFEELIEQDLKNSSPVSKNLDDSKNTSEETKSKDSLSTSGEEKTYYEWWFIILIALVCVLISIVGFNKTAVTSLFGASSVEPFNVERVINELRNEFNDQPEDTFRVVKAAIKRVTSKEASAPGILVLISSKKSQGTNSKFALNLAKFISGQNDVVSIQPNRLLNADQLKKEIDTSIRSNLTEKSLRGVLVNKLDQLPFEAAMIFHSFCDHENAPFKKAVYVMTVAVPGTISPALKIRDWDLLASASLSSAWKDSSEDQVNSLVSRLTGSVAAIVDKS